MRRSIFPLAAIATVGLTGCGNPFDATDREDAQPVGTSGETAAADTAETGQPPSFGDIREDVFTAMLEAESVTISGEVEAGEADLDELYDTIDADTTGEISISGALDGTDSEMSFTAGDASVTQRAVEGAEYFLGEDFAALLLSELDEEVAEEISQDFVEDLVGDQWVQFEEEGGSVFSAEEFITTWQQELDDDEIDAMEAEAETREDQEVWVYTTADGETEYIVSAQDEPYLLGINDSEAQYTFTEWNDSPAPDAPEPDEYITLDEIFEAIAEEYGWPTEELEEDADDVNDD